MLLDREDVNPNLVDPRNGHTSLFDAVAKGHEGIIRTLLNRNDINIDIRDNKGPDATLVSSQSRTLCIKLPA